MNTAEFNLYILGAEFDDFPGSGIFQTFGYLGKISAILLIQIG